MRRRDAKRHISKAGTKTYERHRSMDEARYVVYECDYCDEEFTHRMDSIGSRETMLQNALEHFKEEHPDEVSKGPYPNEEAFREWADEIGANIINRDEPKSPLVVSYGDGREVALHADGSIVLTAFSHLGGSDDRDDVRVEGSRLVVEQPSGDKRYVSQKAFPVLR